MPYVPPWLSITPEYFINAIRSGSQAGAEMASNALRARSIDEQAQESAAHTGLGYAQLGQRAAESGAEQQMAAARIRDQQAQMAALQNYRQQLEDNRERDDARADQLLQVTRNREGVAQSREDRLAQLAEASAHKPLIRTAGLDIVSYNPDTEEVTPLYRAKPAGGSGSKLRDLLGLTGTDTNSPESKAPAALPANKDKLVKGQIYQTKYGPAEWDGEQFVMPRK